MEQAISAYVTQQFSSADVTLTLVQGADANSNATAGTIYSTGTVAVPVSARNMYIECQGTTSGNFLYVPLNKKLYYVYNNISSGGGTITVKPSSGSGTSVAIPVGQKAVLVCDGTNIVSATTYFATFASPSAVLTGGTIDSTTIGATTATTVRGTTITATTQFTGPGTGLTGTAASLSIGGTAATATTATTATNLSGGSVAAATITASGSTVLGPATGGSQGSGTLNAQGIYVNGVAVGLGNGSVSNVSFLTYPAFLTASVTNPTTTAQISLGLSGTALPVSSGGTGQITANNALNALLPSQTTNSGKYLTTNGTDTSWATVSAAAVPYTSSGTGAVSRTTASKLSDTVSINDFGADGTSSGDSAALRAAIAYAEALDLPVVLPARRIIYDGTAITNDKVRLWGQGMPTVNAGKTALSGGTIIEGKLVLTGKYIELRDFGVDLGTAGTGPDADGIKCTSATLNGGVHLNVQNLVALCKYKTSVVHALLFESYQKVTGGNLYGVNGSFGCVIKCQEVQLTTVHTDTQNDTGLYIKSDSTYGTASSIQIDEVRTKTADTMGVRVQSDSATLKSVQIGKLHASDHDRSLCIQLLSPSGVDIKNVHIGSMISERSVTADVSILPLLAATYIDNVTIDDLIAIDPAGKVVECSTTGYLRYLSIKRIYASYAAGTTQTIMDSAVFVDGNVLSTCFDDVTIIENYGTGTKFGAINYLNTSNPSYNILGKHRCKVIGTGRPLHGNLNQTLSGATATLQIPENIMGEGISFCRITIAANAIITTFTPEWANQTWKPGHILYVYNNSIYVLSVAHNVGQGILNQGSATVAIASNEVASWINIGGSVWSQLKIS
jgi:hypothetical protein